MPSSLYQSPPNSNGNDGALPASYDRIWQTYTNLTQAQIAAFQAFPEDLLLYASTRRWQAEITGTVATFTPTGAKDPITIPLDTSDRSKTLLIGMRQAVDDGLVGGVSFIDKAGQMHSLDAAGVKAVHGAAMAFVQQLFAAQVDLSAGISATPPTVTTRRQIDVVFASLAPNSPSAVYLNL